MFKPFNADENNQRNEWLRSLTHEDALALIANNGGKCGHGCSTCDTGAFYIMMMPDKGIMSGSVQCLRAATYWARLIEQDKAEGIRPEWQSTLTRVPTADQRAGRGAYDTTGVGIN